MPKQATETEFQSKKQVALTLYRDVIHCPGDRWFGYATGPAGQHAILSWS